MMTMQFKKYIHSNTAFCILFYLKFLHFTFLHFYTFHLLGALLRQFHYSLPEQSVHLQCSPVRNTAIACIYVPFCDYNSLTFCLCSVMYLYKSKGEIGLSTIIRFMSITETKTILYFLSIYLPIYLSI